MSKESNENLPRSTDMESSLRDRIIAALVQADQDWCSDRPLHEDMADAVIRDVLTPEFLADLVIEAIQKAADDD